MKQIIQNFKTGVTSLEEVPAPLAVSKTVLIQTTCSLVSLGTERMLVQFGKAGLISKARQQPEKVKQVIDKIKTEGLVPTVEAVFKKLDQPIPLGYSNVGRVIAIGKGVSGIQIGDRVVSNGCHAEVVAVPSNLVAKIPDNVSDDEASFAVLGAIGLQGIRLIKPTFGETIVVYGLGLIGLLTVQMCKASGCKVIGVDLDVEKCRLAESWGIQTINPTNHSKPSQAVLDLTGGVGADGVIITASSPSNEIVSESAKMSRKRGRIVLIGVVGLNISRADFYEKELTFQVSCSYGPGRYDDQYEQKGLDYPIGFVRWTENRNFQAVLNAMANNQLSVKQLITEKVPLNDFMRIYGSIEMKGSIASLLEYSTTETYTQDTVQLSDLKFTSGKGILAIVGAGNFTSMTVLPALKKTNAQLKYICSARGLNSTVLAKKYGVRYSTTNFESMLQDEEVDTVLIITRHDLHANMVLGALSAGKHVFVEKPLALNLSELEKIIQVYQDKKHGSLTVGFNRRFSPHIRAIKASIGDSPGEISINATMNAGFIDRGSWVQDMTIGGGRIIGEACHYFDLAVYLTRSKIQSVCTNSLGTSPPSSTDNASMLLRMENGSQVIINYYSNGARSYSKERIEVFSGQRTYIIDNFKSTKAYGVKGFKNLRTKINKGHNEQFSVLMNRIKNGGDPIIPFDEMVNVTRATFSAIQSLKEKCWVPV